MRRLAPLLVCLFAPALTSAAVPDSDVGLGVPGLTSALAEDALAPRENPAGLGFMEGGELQFLHLRAPGARTTGLYWGTHLGPFAVGYGQEWLDGPDIGRERRTNLSLAIGGRSFSVGGSARWLRPAGVDRRLVAYDVGVAGRFHPHFALSLRARDLGQAERTSIAAGAGVRMLRDRVTLGVDRIWRNGDDALSTDGLLSWGFLVRLYDGLGVSGHLIHPLSSETEVDTFVQLALTLDLPHVGFGLGHAPQAPLTANAYAGVRLSTARHRTPIVTSGMVLLDLEDALAPDESFLFPGERRDPFMDLVRLLDQIRRDPEAAGIILRTAGRSGLSFSEVEELRQSIGRLRESGKWVYFYLDGADDWTVYLASSGDRIIAAPSATFTANGLTATVTFLGEGLEKIGVNPQFVRAGIYKTAPDALERRDISEPHREVVESVLDDTYQRYVFRVGESLNLDRAGVEAALSQGVYGPLAAMEAGIVDAIAYPDELGPILAEAGLRPRIITDYADRRHADRRWGRPPTIAVIPITGTIVQGETPTGPFQSADVTGSSTVVRAIERAVEDPSVAAIVLRIDSPGGEVHASDLIWRAARRANEEMPVVASMGSVAASGGYYVAMGARHVVANPSTITGSIGVFAGTFDLSGLLGKLGIHQAVFLRGDQADIFGVSGPWSDAERATVQAYVDESYEEFLARVADARGLNRDQVDAVAQGRVWTGAQAKRRRLVDQLGTFQDAVEHAKAEAGIRPEQVVDVSLYTGVNGPLAAFTGRGRPLSELVGTAPAMPPALEALVRQVGPFLWVRSGEPLALMPWRVEVR
jgi:protease IV